MKIYYGFERIERNPKRIITVGTFDGVHLGHQKILKRLNEIAQITQGVSLIITFEPHPQFVIKRPDKDPLKLLTTIDERLILFEKFGVNEVLVVPFTQDFARTTAEEFIRNYLYDTVGFSNILVGHDHLFGRNREGNFDLLVKLSKELHFEVEKIPAFILNEITISSTKIRNALSQNQIELANQLLGYEYFIKGKVVSGDGRGSSLGFPTANIRFNDGHKLVPSDGVYLVYSILDGEKVYGMANLGFRPTFYTDKKRILEVHYLNFSNMLYGKEIFVHFLKYLRNEKKFNSIDDLLMQLNKDKEFCLSLIQNIN